MPKGVKTCPKCKKETGPRTQVCECGHEFKPKNTALVEAAAAAGVNILNRGTWTVPENFDVPDHIADRLRPIYVQSGVPPVRLRLVNGEIPSDEEIYDWAVAVRNKEIAKGCWLENHAVFKWAEWDLWELGGIDADDPRIKRVEELINGFPDYRTSKNGSPSPDL